MMVNRPARQIAQLRTGSGDAGLARGIGVADHRIGVGYIELIADQHDAERRIQMIDEHRSLVRQTVAVGVAEQQDALAGLSSRVCCLLDPVHDDFLRSVDRRGRGASFNHQDVTVRQHIQRAGIRKPGRELLDFEARRDGRRRAVPTRHLCGMHRRQQVLMNRGKIRIGAKLPMGVDGSRTARGGREQAGDRQGGKPDGAHGGSPSRTPTRWRYTMLQPFHPVTSRSSTTTADSVKPVGTTDV